jgi:uncharacterized membrane protein
MDTFARTDPFAAQRPAEFALIDAKFAANRLLTLWHVVLGGLFLLFVPLQFSSTIRNRYIRLHRWSGRILLPAVILAALPGLYFGVLMPYGGPVEAVAVAAAGSMIIFGAWRGFQAIRRGNADRHREWMIRVFALALAISTDRVIGGPIDLALTPHGVRPPTVFAISVWAAWTMTLAVAELWIRYTRRQPG